MYYPYLYGKQFELIALREFSNRNSDNNKIVPIIEPVKTSFNGLTKAIEVMCANNLRFAIVLNPHEGDFKRVPMNILPKVSVLSENASKWIPAFVYDNNRDYIKAYVHQNHLHDIMIIFKYEVEMDGGLQGFLSDVKIKYLVNGCPNARFFSRHLKGMGDKLNIRLDDCFKEQKRNVDYLNIEDEKFTEEHKYYQEDGYAGFSDYTVLPKEFVDGGMLPYAIAIHLTYPKTIDEIYVHHFVSDTNDDATNIQKKFFEATTKVVNFFSNHDKTLAISELTSLLDEGRFPGLGFIKKLSIRSHLELMNSII